MFRFLYVTDLHGWAGGYEAVLQTALDRGIKLIVNGGDMLPKGGAHDLQTQRLFLEEFMPQHMESLAAAGVEVFAMFGNDDMACLLPDWRDVLEAHANAHDLTDGWRRVGQAPSTQGGSGQGGAGQGFILRGCPFVPDVPFALKDWAVLDTPDFQRPSQYAPPVLSTLGGYEPIDDVEGFFRSRGTLADRLERLAAEAPSLERAILVTHSPPFGTGTGCIAIGGWDVGSKAVRKWIDRHQPLLTLHGHIHESPEVTGVHTARLGRTVVHQPGQVGRGAVIFSVVTIEGGQEGDQVSIERLVVPIRGRRTW
jgi:uncharacterized protein